MYHYSKKSQAKLDTCDHDLQVLANEVLKYHDASVVWGHRNEEEQERMFRKKVSKLHFPRSKHNSYPSRAIDLVAYVPSLGGQVWTVKYSLYFAGLVLGIADMLYAQGKMTHKVRWGGNWSSKRDVSFTKVRFYDGYHFELVAD
jgi:peptidoglycan L-alanyl-D-glutamate endopeptidase CwlK